MSQMLADSLGHAIGIDATMTDSAESGIDTPLAFFDHTDTPSGSGKDHRESSGVLKISDETPSETSIIPANSTIFDHAGKTDSPAPQSGIIAESLVPLNKTAESGEQSQFDVAVGAVHQTTPSAVVPQFDQMRPLPDLLNPGINNANGAGVTTLINQTFDAVDGRYEFSGNQDIDAVLIGSRWTITTLTFSFPTSGSFYSGQGYGAGTEPDGQIAFNAAQQTAVRYALGLVSAYTNLHFSEIAETASTHANLRFSQTSYSQVQSAYANFPSSSAQAGDIWFGTTGQPFYTTPGLGNWGQATIMHELGHAFGLKHGHDDYTNVDLAGGGYLDHPSGGGARFGSAALPSNHDGQDWSLMTYRSNPGSPVTFQGDGFNQPQTYMQDDIAALQYLYGANFSINASNTVYTWSATTGAMSINGVVQGTPADNTILSTLWDGNGNDTYDLSNYTTDMSIDLRPGQFSTFSQAQLANHQPLTGIALAEGNIANALLYQNDLRSLIENAYGGSGADTMVGNQVANVIRGNGGADTLIGDAGSDTLYGGDNADALYGDGRPGSSTGVGMGGGSVTKPAGLGNNTLQTALDVTNQFSLASNANVIDSTTTPHVTISGTGDNNRDYYEITVTAGTTLTFDIDSTSGLDSFIQLYNSSGNIVAFDDDSQTTDGAGGSTSSTDSFLVFTVATSGTYIIEVGDYFSSTSNQPILAGATYQLQISAAGSPAVGTGTGNDVLDGGTGADTMQGGLGNDTYYVDNAGDHVIETLGQGTDNVQAYVSFNMGGQELENLQLRNAANINGTGNSIANIINGNSGVNILTGLGGNDTLDGNIGADTMQGGIGDDTYYVDNAGDHVIETVGQGIDRVFSSVSFNLAGQELENLTLTGAASINGTGNSIANVITGNSGVNILTGLGGNDTLDGSTGADTMQGGIGNDTYYVDNAGDHVVETLGQGIDNVQAYVSFNLSGQELENLQLRSAANINGTGNSIANVINGNSGNNIIDGLGGADTMSGVQGNDTYYVDNAGDHVIETLGQGIDNVQAYVSFNLSGQELENLALRTSASINGTGNSIANVITGNSGNNVINGLGGNDTLSGNTGNDTFVFTTALNASTNVDTITDFSVADDTIQVDNAIFAALGGNGTLTVDQFIKNTTGLAGDSSDHIVYETDTGWLYYDSNGSAAGGSTHFATLAANLALTNADFVVV